MKPFYLELGVKDWELQELKEKSVKLIHKNGFSIIAESM
jgi:hypothetical protein